MTTPHTPTATTRRFARWTGLALIIAAMTACSPSQDAATSPTDSETTSLAATSAAPTTTVPPAAAPVTTPSTTTPSTTTPPAAPRPSAAVDELVAVAGARLHLRCTGSGLTTVVLIAGWNDDRTTFDTIEPALATSARVCAYDKFGTGTSDPAPGPQRFSMQATDLHDLLLSTNEIGPYVVVGHSFGGDVAVSFASKFADEVRGVLLLDATPTSWNSVLCAVADDGTAGSAALAQICASQAAANNTEGIDGPAAFAEMAEISSLGSVPLIVATAADRHYIDQGVDPELAAQLTDAWNLGQAHWVSLSSAAQLVEVADTGHYIHADQPDLVIGQIRSLLA